MDDSGQTVKGIAENEPPDIEEKIDFAVKAPKTPATKPKVVNPKAIDDDGWETPVGKKVLRGRRGDGKNTRSEGGRAFRSEGKSGPGSLRIEFT
jgi:hypothetical protein